MKWNEMQKKGLTALSLVFSVITISMDVVHGLLHKNFIYFSCTLGFTMQLNFLYIAQENQFPESNAVVYRFSENFY
jgi:hypothetical protein